MLEDLIIVILGAAYGVCAFFLGFLYGRLYQRKRLIAGAASPSAEWSGRTLWGIVGISRAGQALEQELHEAVIVRVHRNIDGIELMETLGAE